jgi:CMP-N-acetylneuraminic acid synthetase
MKQVGCLSNKALLRVAKLSQNPPTELESLAKVIQVMTSEEMLSTLDMNAYWPGLNSSLIQSVEKFQESDLDSFITICNALKFVDDRGEVSKFDSEDYFDLMKQKIAPSLEQWSLDID